MTGHDAIFIEVLIFGVSAVSVLLRIMFYIGAMYGQHRQMWDKFTRDKNGK